MDDLVKYLIKCEEEAKDKIEKSHAFKEQMKKQALHDSEMELKLMESELEQKLEIKKSENELQLSKLKKSLEEEYEKTKLKYVNINFDEIIEHLTNKISGKN